MSEITILLPHGEVDGRGLAHAPRVRGLRGKRIGFLDNGLWRSMRILADEFGEKTHFTLRSDVLVGVGRTFHSFSEALEDVKDARVFAGIHFRTACDDGSVVELPLPGLKSIRALRCLR